jgi:hypothetical protein
MSRLVIADDLREESLDEFLREARTAPQPSHFVITDPDDVAEAVSAMRHGATAVIEIRPRTRAAQRKSRALSVARPAGMRPA